MFEATQFTEERVETDEIGGLTADRVEDLLRRRGLSRRTVHGYLSQLRRTERFCRERTWPLRALSEDQLATYLASLPQTQASLRIATVALSHYWKAMGRIDAPGSMFPS